MRNEALLKRVREAAKSYYVEANKNTNSFGIVIKEPRKLKRALKKAENDAFYGGFSEYEIELARRGGLTEALK